MNAPRFTFEDAWRETVGEEPALGSPLLDAFTDPAVRAAWSAGEPLLRLVSPLLIQPIPHRAWGSYASEQPANG